MSLFSLLGALEIGLIFSLVALGVLISFRILNFPDLTVDGSFPMGGAVAATLIAGGHDPFMATLGGTLAGAVAGFITGWLNVRLKIMDLLASILMMIALYSVNLRIMASQTCRSSPSRPCSRCCSPNGCPTMCSARCCWAWSW